MVHAQPAGYTKVADTAYILQKVNEVASQTNTINTEFVQEKNLAFLYEKIISKGILLYQKPDKLRLEYTSPFNYLLIMNSGELLIRNDNNEIKIDLESSTMFNEINELIMAIQKHFKVRIADQNQARHILESINTIADFLIKEKQKA
jgi:outer membrane lipoprotein-sorting protein